MALLETRGDYEFADKLTWALNDLSKQIARLNEREEKKAAKEIVYTHNVAADIVELFEDLLSENGILIKSPEDDERGDDNEAALYGTTYSNLLDQTEEILIETLEKAGVSKDNFVTGVFCG